MSYQPYSLVNQLHNEINRVFGASLTRGDEDAGAVAADWIPAVDIREDEDGYVLHADLPGVDPEAIEITMENGMLTLRGERASEAERRTNAFRRIERTSGRFFRRFSLPDSADADRITATGRHGVLEISIPKHEKVQPRRITVQQ